MRKAKLTEVPSHIIAHASAVGRRETWQAEYNVAAWFRFKHINNEQIKLNIIWVDEQGHQSTTVDHSSINSSAILMSGIARLHIHGAIRHMAVEVETDISDYSVDELFVQPAHRHLSDTKRASNQ